MSSIDASDPKALVCGDCWERIVKPPAFENLTVATKETPIHWVSSRRKLHGSSADGCSACRAFWGVYQKGSRKTSQDAAEDMDEFFISLYPLSIKGDPPYKIHSLSVEIYGDELDRGPRNKRSSTFIVWPSRSTGTCLMTFLFTSFGPGRQVLKASQQRRSKSCFKVSG